MAITFLNKLVVILGNFNQESAVNIETVGYTITLKGGLHPDSRVYDGHGPCHLPGDDFGKYLDVFLLTKLA